MQRDDAGVERTIRVAVAGASGRMGREALAAVAAESGLTLVAAVSRAFAGKAACGSDLRSRGVATFSELEACLGAASPDVVVDFTSAAIAPALIRTALEAGACVVSGTTGMSPEILDEIAALAKARRLGAIVVPNFSVGATVLRVLARTAAAYFEACEIVELHHDKKRDAPSGTALALAEVVGRNLGRPGGAPTPLTPGAPAAPPSTAPASLAARGLAVAGVPVHSVRLPGLVGHHEVIFGATGETLTLRHDSLSRVSFMPGVLLAVRAVVGLSGLVTSLEDLLPGFGVSPSPHPPYAQDIEY